MQERTAAPNIITYLHINYKNKYMDASETCSNATQTYFQFSNSIAMLRFRLMKYD